MGVASGNPGGFDVSLYSSSSSGPGIDLGNLTGSNPSSGGLLTYSTAGITLSANTFYYVVLTASTPVAEGAYNWSEVSSFTGGYSWEIYPLYYSSTNGNIWTGYGRSDFFQMAIYASPAPEPTVYAFVASGALLLGLLRWRNSSR